MKNIKHSSLDLVLTKPWHLNSDFIFTYLIYVMALGILWWNSDFAPNFSTPEPKEPRFKGIGICSSIQASQASIQSKDHTGATVSIPVGSRITGLKRWSNPSSWPGNVKPQAGDDVVIPVNSVIVLDENVDVKSITVFGKLIVDLTKTINLSAEYIVVSGSTAYLECGTKTEPFPNKFVLTLVGNDPTKKIPGTTIESKAVIAMDGATLELHGKVKTSWTNLAANVSSGNLITIATNASNWEIGDVILISPSRLNENEGEQHTITNISADKRTFTLAGVVKFPHIGVSKQYTRSSDGKTWTGDMRAEVGLLSKSIKIQGDAGSDASQFGGHVMIHTNGKAFVEGIELYRMGQKDGTGKGILGRYPFHWHLIQEKGAGQYFNNNSVHKSFNRAITIHGTESTVVENNFCYDHLGHGIFLEDGSERFNIIRGNVVLLTKRPPIGEEIIPSDNEANEVQNRTPASFWITNPNNIFENNVAAGTHGTGFWFAMPRKPMGPSASLPRFSSMLPFREPLGKFSGNKAHSCASGFDIFDQLTAAHALIRNGGWERTDLRVMDNCTWYACDLAIYGGIGGGRTYTQNVIFRNNVFLDNVTAVMHANYSVVEQSVFVANSGENVFVGERQLSRGYDGAFSIKNSHLVGWQASNANYLQNTGGAMKHVNYSVSGMTKDHQGPPRMSLPNYAGIPKGEVGSNSAANPRFWSYVTWDIDGSLGGKPNTSIITNHPLCRDGSEVRYENWTNIYRTDRRFAYMLLDFEGDPKMTLVRTKLGTPKAGQFYINGFYGTFIHFPVMVNDGFLYTMQFETLGTSTNFGLRMMDDYVAGDQVLYRIKDFGKFAGITVSNSTKLTTLSLLRSFNANGYAIDNGDLYIKMVSIASTPDIACTVSWTGTVALPKLDTDGDGVTDVQESIDGTDPIENDPIPVNPVLPVSTCTAAITAPVTSFCAGGSVVLTASSGASYKWFNGTTVLPTITGTHTATVAGSYTLEVTNVNGCRATSVAKIITVTTASTWYADTDSDGKGDPNVKQISCTQPIGYVATAGDGCTTDPLKIAAGNCGCNKIESSCLDCAGVANGTAKKDACAICAGGTTGIVPITDASLCGGGTIGIKGPACLEAGKTYSYSLTSDNIPVSSISWWSSNGAAISESIGNEKLMTIEIPSYASGSTTLNAGVNFTTSPWYKAYSLVVKIGGCAVSARIGVTAEASPLPFSETTIISLENETMIDKVVVLDLNGVEVVNSTKINTTTFELGRELPAGVYVVYIYSSYGVTMKKVMKLN